MHVRNLGYPFHLQSGGPETTFFRTFRNLMANLTAYIFGTKHDIHRQSVKCIDNYKGSPTSSQNVMNFGPQTALNQTGHMLGSACDLKTHVRNLGYPVPIKNGSPKTTFFRRLRNLTANLTAYSLYLQSETRHKQPVKCVGHYRGSSRLSKNFMDHKRLEIGPEFLPNLR